MKLDPYLAILQQAEYDLRYFRKWYQKHGDDPSQLTPKPTLKIRLIKIVSLGLFFLPLVARFRAALVIINLVELPIRILIYSLAIFKLRILQLLGLKVVALAGSYAKTSTKHLLKHTVGKQTPTLITPKSINTPLGISQIVLSQLKLRHRLFVVELGEYYQGDIIKLARFVKPNFGIMTPIGRQHLERMGSIDKIATTIGELHSYFKGSPTNILIAQENKQFFKKQNLNFYGEGSDNQYHLSHLNIDRRGTEFVVNLPQKKLKAFSPLYGEHQAVNSLPSFWLAQKLGLDPDKIGQSLATVPYIARRHEPTFGENNVLILDNSYNTNPDSVKASLKLITQLEASRRLIVTLGFVELGDQSTSIHRQFGQDLFKKVDYLGLIEADHTQDIIDGFLKAGGKRSQIVTAANPDGVLKKLQDKIIPNSIILLEGGFQELFV